MQFIPIKTRTILPPKDDLFDVFDHYLQPLQEGDVLLITSKILAIHQGRCLPVQTTDKATLVAKESDHLIADLDQEVTLTIKNRTFIPWAGIDESNANGYYVLWPDHIDDLLQDLHQYLCQKFTLKNLGIVATDSNLIPFRRGSVGMSIGHYGFNPLRDYRGDYDLFGRPLYLTQANVVDALAAMAVLLMGEGRESIPMVVARGVSFVDFAQTQAHMDLYIPPEEDLFRPFLNLFQPTSKTIV